MPPGNAGFRVVQAPRKIHATKRTPSRLRANSLLLGNWGPVVVSSVIPPAARLSPHSFFFFVHHLVVLLVFKRS